MPLLIAAEGLDGSGKTTFSTLLATKLGAVWLTTPSPELREVRDRVLEGLGNDPLAVELLYAATVQAASARAAELLAEGRSVVIDRYWLSTVVYARQRPDFAELREVEDRLLPADLTVWIDVPLAVRRERALGRGVSGADLETFDPARDAALRRGYLAASGRPIVGRMLRLDGRQAPADLVAAVVACLPEDVDSGDSASTSFLPAAS